MSATSITPKNRDTIYERLLKDFLKGGNDLILYRHFALGKGWDKSKMHFQYLYLDFLCNMSCSVDHYFNEMIKSEMEVDCETKLSHEDQVSLFNEEYCSWVNNGNSGDFVSFLLKQIQTGCTVECESI